CEINPVADYDDGSTTRNISLTNLHLSSGAEVAFDTNPLVGSIAFGSTLGSFTTEFSNGEHSFFVPGKYSATATPPEDYIFAHWQVEGGVSLTGQSLRSNPIAVNVTGNGVLKAVFAAKLSFLTDPPDVGSISIS